MRRVSRAHVRRLGQRAQRCRAAIGAPSRRPCTRNSRFPSAPRSGDAITSTTTSPVLGQPVDAPRRARRGARSGSRDDAALADLRPSRLELRLHEQHEVAVGGRAARQRGRDGHQRDEGEVGDGERRPAPPMSAARGDGRSCARSTRDARVGAQRTTRADRGRRRPRTTCAAPRWSRQSVKPPVEAPASRQRRPRRRPRTRRARAASFSPPRDTNAGRVPATSIDSPGSTGERGSRAGLPPTQDPAGGDRLGRSGPALDEPTPHELGVESAAHDTGAGYACTATGAPADSQHDRRDERGRGAEVGGDERRRRVGIASPPGGATAAVTPREHERERPAERVGQRTVGRRPVAHDDAGRAPSARARAPPSAPRACPRPRASRPDAVATAAAIAPAPGISPPGHRIRRVEVGGDEAGTVAHRPRGAVELVEVEARGGTRRPRPRRAARRRRRARPPRAPRPRPGPAHTRTRAPGAERARRAAGPPRARSVRTSSASAVDAHARELGDDVADRQARVVRHEADAQARGSRSSAAPAIGGRRSARRRARSHRRGRSTTTGSRRVANACASMLTAARRPASSASRYSLAGRIATASLR